MEKGKEYIKPAININTDTIKQAIEKLIKEEKKKKYVCVINGRKEIVEIDKRK